MKETLTGRPHDTSVQKAKSDNENVDAVRRHALDNTWCGCSLTSCPGRHRIRGRKTLDEFVKNDLVELLGGGVSYAEGQQLGSNAFWPT